MGEENKIRDAADAIKGLVETVPVYQDVVQPAAKEVGTALQTVAKTIHIALAPVSALVWGYEQIKDFLNKALTERLKDIPQEQIITPNPAIAGPAIESLRFTANEPSLRELYANLLATSMDSKTAHQAHPAFVEILKQLAPDEARILKYMADQGIITWPTAFLTGGFTVELEAKPETAQESGLIATSLPIPFFSTLGQDAGCIFPDLVPSYINNLCRLGLIEIYKDSSMESVFSAVYTDLEDRLKRVALEDHADRFEGEVVVRLTVERKAFRKTSLGQQFFSACIV
jgi:hypothetical protein